MLRDPGYMVEPESVLPTPAPVTIQTSLMTSRRNCRPPAKFLRGEDAALGVASVSLWA